MNISFNGVDKVFTHTYENLPYVPNKGDFVVIGGIHHEVAGVTHYLDDCIVMGQFEGPKYVHVHLKEVPSLIYYWDKVGMLSYDEDIQKNLIKSEIKRLQELLKNGYKGTS